MTEGALSPFARLLVGGGASQRVLSCLHMDNNKNILRSQLLELADTHCGRDMRIEGQRCQPDDKKKRSESLELFKDLKIKEKKDNLNYDYFSDMYIVVVY